MRTEVIVDIVYSAFIQDYFIYFILLLLGYFVLVRFLGYIFGNIPFIKKMFLNNDLMTLLIWTPLLIGIYKVMSNIDNAYYFLEYKLFLILFICISIFIFIYNGTKQLYPEFTLLLFIRTYKFSVIVILIIASFYVKNYFNKNFNFIKNELRNEIRRDLRNIKINNQSMYSLAKTMAKYFVKTTNQQLRIIDSEKENILNSFNEKIKVYDSKYESLTQLINESRSTIQSMEKRYQNKIDIVDSEIDNKKLKLDSIYKEWVNNVDNNIGNLDGLVKESKDKMQLLNNNKKLMDEFRNELNLLDKKLFDITNSLASENEKNRININKIKEERTKSADKFILLQDKIKEYQDSFNLLEENMIKMEEKIKRKDKEVLDIKSDVEKIIDKKKSNVKKSNETNKELEVKSLNSKDKIPIK